MSSRAIDLPCTVEVAQTHDAFHAHVTLDGDLILLPGDSVRVHGGPIETEFGQTRVEKRVATVTRAGPIRRAWTRLASRFEMKDLYEVSFTPRRSF